MILEKTPSKQPASWPPKGYTKAHQVKDKENWWKLADMYGRKDPWDIIQYNFETTDPKEVNWFLRKLVGCTKSKDSMNYSFASTDSPGKVYIPPKSWVPGGSVTPPPPPPPATISAEDKAAKKSVLHVLG